MAVSALVETPVVPRGISMVERMSVAEYKRIAAKDAGTQPESLVLNQCRDYLRTLGWYVIRIQQGIGCHRGVSDLICVKDGRVVFLEIKATKGKLGEHQQRFCMDIVEHGGEYHCVHSLDEMIELLRGTECES